MEENLCYFADSVASIGQMLLTHWIVESLGSVFLVLAATAIAAFFGAYGAQRIAERIQKKRRLLEEIRNTNAASMTAFGVLQAYLGTKAQLIAPLKTRYDNQQAAARDYYERARREPGVQQEEFEIQFDFQFLRPINVPIEILRDLLFEKISIVGRPLAVAIVLSRTIDELNEAIVTRNQLIREFNATKIPESALVYSYLGLVTPKGNQDSRYYDSMNAIHTKTDDCIWFSKRLCEDMVDHGKQLAQLFGKKAPQVHTFDFTVPEKAGLFPDDAEFSDWLNMVTHPPYNL